MGEEQTGLFYNPGDDVGRLNWYVNPDKAKAIKNNT